jgi:hypothetical protein
LVGFRPAGAPRRMGMENTPNRGEAMPSRRKRKRERQQADAQADMAAERRGDRCPTPPEDSGKPLRGVRGAVAGLWANASRSELVLLRHAIRERWPIPEDRRGPCLEEVFSRLHDKGTPTRLLLTTTGVFLAANKHNLDLFCEALRAERGRKRRAGRKWTVEECLQLAAEGWASRPSPGVWRWEDRGSDIGYKFSPEASALLLDYTVERPDAEPEVVAYWIRLVTEPRRFGGTRWLFVCPLASNGVACGRRVGDLYLPPEAKWFGCRHCWRLSYASRQDRNAWAE